MLRLERDPGNLMADPITEVKREGQKFLDEPVYASPKPELITNIALSVGAAFNEGRPRAPRRILLGHERVQLRWMKPDGKGGLVPRDGGKR